ncbi:MAG: adenylyltransferase/cytidyltransferase family protein [Ruminococcus flavefaciens]|nr:adenylyltransferase/cytidyltransferase family protein [Roseburia sp.]MCM1231431.1 adenylyltransferase/cytidyltransferase family protein [Ruminococcus flavefaciens]
MNSDEIITDLPKSLINWYDFRSDTKILFISGGKTECETLFDALLERQAETVKAAMTDLSALNGTFDYIVAAGIIEKSEFPVETLAEVKRLLKVSGKFLIGVENRLAIRQFCGDKDSFTGHVFDGIDGYIKVSEQRRKIYGGRAYTRTEYEKMLYQAGFSSCRFYAVMPELVCPQILVAEAYIPNERFDIRIFPQYQSPETLFLEEERLYETLLENHMFHQMANAFLIEGTIGGTLSDIDQITVQGDRGREEALATLIKEQKWVIKKALYEEGLHKIGVMLENDNYLKQHGVPMLDAHIENNAYVMPYVNGQNATEYFREIMRKDVSLFLHEITRFRELILSSSEHVPYEDVNWFQFEPWWENRKKDDPNIDKWQKRAYGTTEEKENIGVILKRGYIDMVSINCFHTEEGFLFFDQEFYLENFPANAVFIRTIDFIYRNSSDLEKIYPREELLKHFSLYEYQATWRGKGNAFLQKLRNEKELSEYHRRRRKDYRIIAANRHRMDYTQEAYERLFTNIFKGTEGRSIWLFGSGKYSEQFIQQFGRYCDIVGIVDNSQERWGNNLLGVEIYSPDVLLKAAVPFKVFICIKFFEDVLVQLKSMGIKNISVYDPQIDYERPVRLECRQENTKLKKYHIGYVAGVFDLFHIGHLNLLRRAKEQCDYLIVGVVTDEQVINTKKTRPYMAFEERFAIVQACRYVDEAVEIPADRPSTEDAYYMYHFDAQFSGSDYADDPYWHAKKVFLQQHGSDLVFFPYTESTSSTQIKELIGRKLL